MKVTLINTIMVEGDNIVPSMGIMYLAAVLEKDGHEVQLFHIDPNYCNIEDDIKKFVPDLVGVGFLTNTYQPALKLTKRLKQILPEAIFFSGGVHTTINPEEVLGDFDVDFCVCGEGELTVREICNNFAKGKKSLAGIKGVVYRYKNKIVKNAARELIQNLDDLPFPARHLLDFEKLYLTYPGVIRGYWCKSTTIMTSRGCPYNCIYCGSNIMFGRKVRRRSVRNVIDEIKFLQKTYNVKGIFFLDDTFTIDPEWVMKFCKELVNQNIRLIWACQARVNTVSDELLAEMKRSGCVQVDFGVESGSNKILNILKKGTNVGMIKNAFKLTRKHGIRTLATFMVNSPFETKEDIEETFRLAKDINPDFASFFFTTPFPGTELYTLAISQGWLNPSVAYDEKWNIRDADKPIMNINSNFTNEELIRIRSKMQNYFFIKNYLRLNNIRVGLYLIKPALNPKMMRKIFRQLLSTKKIDHVLELLLTGYRLNILRSVYGDARIY